MMSERKGMSWIEEKSNRIIDFVISREQEEGGFSFAAIAPPTLEDTYYALRVFDELNFNYENEKTCEFVKGTRLTNKNMFSLFQFLFLAKKLGIKYDKRKMINSVKTSFSLNIDSIYYAMRCAEILKENSLLRLLKNKSQQYVSSQKIADTIDVVSKQVFLLKKLGIKFNKQEYVAWIKKCQGFEGGFGLGPRSTSFLESTHAALTALSILRSSPNDMDECEKFIRCCQSGRGGFGRQITTVPTLESTYQVVHSFKLINNMRRR